MLSFEQKLAIADSFRELSRKDVSLGRVNYHYEASVQEKKTVIYHLHPNGNGFVYAGELKGYEADAKGLVNIRDYSEDELRALIAQSIRLLGGGSESVGGAGTGVPEPSAAGSEGEPTREERWRNAKRQELLLQWEEEDGMWYVFAGDNLDTVWETYDEAREYLEEEGFSRVG
ncbi:hypothetical protein [Paenibacillus cymbidii]|uniref:hypothetical protein n=1 Tax=Paenibacillus cymbidii TaxID=1639034 RepID=UPI0010813F04|nr:hypothetical protein [Paenibacillus cymbidii]